MKTRLTYTVLRGALLGVVLVLTACVNTLELATPNGRNRSQDREQAIREAVAYFDNHRALLTRSAEAEPTEEAPFIVGDIVVDWESAVAVSNDEKRYTDFTMRKENRFYLLLGQEGEQWEAVELYSRFASVEDFGLDTMNQYVATYIPDVEYLQSYYAVAQDYGINCAEWYEFSGVVLYTMLSGHHIAAYRYEGGELAERAFLYDREQTDEENIADFCSVMEGLTLGVASQQDDTRVVVDNEDKPVEIEEIIIYGKKFPTIFKPQIIGEEDDDNQIVEPTIIGITLPLIGGGGSSTEKEKEEEEEEDSIGEELLEDLFDTSELSDEQKKIVGEMLVEIIRDCMGEELYRQLKAMYEKSEDILTIVYNPDCAEDSMIGYSDDFNSQDESSQTVTVNLFDTTSDVLLHEMFHAYQLASGGSGYDFGAATINYEIEAQLAKYLYGLRNGNNIILSESFELFNTEKNLWYHIADLTAYTNGISIYKQKKYEVKYRYIVQQYLQLESDVRYTYTPPVNVAATISNLGKLSEKCK